MKVGVKVGVKAANRRSAWEFQTW